MAKRCVKCGERIGSKALYCEKCGSVQPTAPVKTASVPVRQRRGGNGLAMVLSALPAAGLIAAVTYMIISVGGNFGVFGYDDIPLDLFDFFEALSGRKTPYQLFLSDMRLHTLWIAVAVGVVSLLLIGKFSRESDNTMFCIGCGVMSMIPLLTCTLLLWLYSFEHSPRIFCTVVFYLLAVSAMALFLYMARYIGYRALPVLALSAAVAAVIAVFLAPILGAGVVFFGELFWIVVIALLACGCGTSGYMIVYVIRW